MKKVKKIIRTVLQKINIRFALNKQIKKVKLIRANDPYETEFMFI